MHNGFKFPTDICATNQQMLDQLAPKRGRAFDKPYVAHMVTGHRQAVQLFEAKSKDAENPQLKEWARRNLPVIRMHLQKAEELAKTLE